MKLIKKTLCILLALSVFISAETTNALAQGSNSTNIKLASNDEYEYKTTNGTVTITKYTGASEQINVPESIENLPVTRIDEKAFSKKNLSSISLPKSLIRIGDSAFSGCTNLTSVSFQEGLESIGHLSFSDCSSLSDIKLPNSVKSIGTECFKGTGITDINITKQMTQLNKAFSGSTIQNITFDEGVTDIPEGAFENTIITQIELPESIKTIKPAAFFHCNNLSRITLSDKLERIYADAFNGCTSLETISFPNSLKIISQDAFKKCSNLKTIFWSDQLTDVHRTAFEGIHPEHRVYVTFGSPAYETVIELGLFFEPIDTPSSSTTTNGIIIPDKSGYSLAQGSINTWKHNVFTITYSCDESKFSGIQKPTVEVYIPKSMEYDNSNLYLNGKKLESNEFSFYTKENTLKIPVSAPTGRIDLYIQTKNGIGQVFSYAALSYTDNAQKKSEQIGSVSLVLPSLTLECSDQVSDDKVRVSGLTTPLTNINIYVDNTLSSTVTSSKSGSYNATVSLGKIGNHKIKVSLAGQETISKTKTIIYSNSAPKVTEFKLYYQQLSNNWRVIDLLNSKTNSHIVSFNPERNLRFTIKFENDNQIKNVRVVSTKNGIKKSIPATKDSSGLYVASGLFDTDNPNYIPGKISVSYQLNDGLFDNIDSAKEVSPEIRKKQRQRILSSLLDPDSGITTDDISVTNKKTTTSPDGLTTTYSFTLTIGNKSQDTYIRVKQISKNDNLTVNELVKKGYLSFSHNDNKYLSICEDQGEISAVIDIMQGGDDRVLNNIFDATVPDSICNTLDCFQFVSDISNYRYHFNRITSDPFLDEDEKNKRIDALMNHVAFTSAKFIINMALIIFAPETELLDFVISNIYRDFSDLIEKLLFDPDAPLKFAIDPSGYVFEAVDTNRLKDVSASIYYKPSLSDTTPILWDAGPYEQVNPLFTDEDGNYAWDVPEGYWQVKFEKDGYETATTEWMPVPPEQTGINISMVSSSAPTVNNLNVFQDGADIEFSQYMDPSTINGIVIKDKKGNDVAYSLNYSKNQKDVTGKTLAKSYSLVFSKDISYDEVTVIIPNSLTSYNGKTTTGETKKYKTKLRPSIDTKENITIKYNTETYLNIKLANYDTTCPFVARSSSDVALNATVKSVDKNGDALVKLVGVIPGDYKLALTFEGTSIQKEIAVNVTEGEVPTDISDTTLPQHDDETEAKPVVFKNKKMVLKRSDLKKKPKRYSIIKKSGGGKLKAAYLKNRKNTKSLCKKYISISKKGIVTVKKGIKKGVYKLKVTVLAKGLYKKTTGILTIKVK